MGQRRLGNNQDVHSIGSPKEDTGGAIGATDPVSAGLAYL